MSEEADDRLLVDVLAEGQRRGLLGPAPLDAQIRHADGFLGAIVDTGGWEGIAVDLGSGGGLPGLVLAFRAPASRWVLLDSRERAWRFLGEAVERLDLGARVDVVSERAEAAGRSAQLRGTAILVTARAFGPPATTAECAAPLLRPGGRLVVSNPPDVDVLERWPEASLGVLGMARAHVLVRGGFGFAVVSQVSACPERYPRRTGLPTKRPLF